jgi:hypothetical protein
MRDRLSRRTRIYLASFLALRSSRSIVHGADYFKVIHGKINFSFKRLGYAKDSILPCGPWRCVRLCLHTHSILGMEYITNETIVRYAVTERWQQQTNITRVVCSGSEGQGIRILFNRVRQLFGVRPHQRTHMTPRTERCSVIAVTT